MPTIAIDGRTIRYEIAGPDGAPVLAFANSLGTTYEMWDAQVPAFADRFRCLRFDTRGHGGSDVVVGVATIDDLADDFAGLLDVLGIDSAHLVGLSLGGMMGQAFAVQHPKRLRSLVLVSTTAHTPPPEAWMKRAETVREHGMAAIADAVMQRWFSAAHLATGGQALNDNRQRFEAILPEGYAHCCEIIGRLDLRDSNNAIACPTFIVVGADDPATPPAMAAELSSQIRGSDLLVLADGAHLLVAEIPDRFNKFLGAFLKDRVR